jgi:hypothetical protein
MRNVTNEENKEFQKYCMVEPKISELRSDAISSLSDKNSPDFWDRYETIKAKLKKYVGLASSKNYPVFMRTSHAYDVVYMQVFVGLL